MSSKTSHVYDISIRILLYKEDGSWVAHALEMDLLGCGTTCDEALAELKCCIDAQISFATAKGTPEAIFFPAPPELLQRWEEAQLISLKEAVLGGEESATKLDVKAIFVSFSKDALNELKSPKKGSLKNWESLAVT